MKLRYLLALGYSLHLPWWSAWELRAVSATLQAPRSGRPWAPRKQSSSNNLGVAEMNRGRTGEAYDHFRQAWQRDSTLFPARLNEGIALLNAQRFDEAQEVLLDATQRQPDNARAWYNLGILYRNTATGRRGNRSISSRSRALIQETPMRCTSWASSTHSSCAMTRPSHGTNAVLRSTGFMFPQSSAWHAPISFPATMTRPGNILIASISSPSRSLENQSALPMASRGHTRRPNPSPVQPHAPAQFGVRFSSAAEQAGLRFEPRLQPEHPDHILPLLGAGACFIDFDKDGRSDLLLLGGMRGIVLYRNEGGGQFTDVSERAGFNSPQWRNSGLHRRRLRQRRI